MMTTTTTTMTTCDITFFFVFFFVSLQLYGNGRNIILYFNRTTKKSYAAHVRYSTSV